MVLRGKSPPPKRKQKSEDSLEQFLLHWFWQKSFPYLLYFRKRLELQVISMSSFCTGSLSYGIPHTGGSLAPTPARRIMSADWKSGLFGCMDEPVICLQTLFCSCVTYGQIAELGPAGVPCQGNCFGAACLYINCAACAVCIVCEARKHIRAASGIEGGCPEDFCTVCCCGSCVLCQLHAQVSKGGAAVGGASFGTAEEPVMLNTMA